MSGSSSTNKRILLVAATTGYQARVFGQAAEKLGVELTLATDRCHVLDDPWKDRAQAVKFERPEESAAAIEGEFDGVVAVGDRPAYAASIYAERAHLPFHPSQALAAAKNKFLARSRFQGAGLPVPDFFRLAFTDPPASPFYPCVLKPLGLSASRGVIRANNHAEFAAAFDRIRALLSDREILHHGDEVDRYILVERFIPGREFALEGLVTGGLLQTLAVFDKPDPLDGPFFEETIYVTPSRHAVGPLIDAAQQAVTALGLRHGPVHAEMRVNDEGVWMLEVAGRPIGGLCAKALKFEPDRSLEELILAHALGADVSGAKLRQDASGVMMIPIPREGLYRGVEGLEMARAVPGVDEIEITAKEGQHFLPLPEGHSYLGFIFARGDEPAEVENSLRTTHEKLQFDLAPVLKVSS